jgi:hypothetical protein
VRVRYYAEIRRKRRGQVHENQLLREYEKKLKFSEVHQVLRRLFLIAVLWFTVSTAMGVVSPNDISTRIIFRDNNAPLELIDPCIPNVYRPVVFGTELSIIVSSDVNGNWGDGGGLHIVDPYRDYGILYGRDYNDETYDWEGSRFPAAGTNAAVYDWQDDFMSGFDMYTDSVAIDGNWFIIDYNAISVGDCNVGFYDYNINWSEPIYNITITHILTPDFDSSGIVDFNDFAELGSNWQRTDCASPEYCSGTDLNDDGVVDFIDLKAFTYFWLESPE